LSFSARSSSMACGARGAQRNRAHVSPPTRANQAHGAQRAAPRAGGGEARTSAEAYSKRRRWRWRLRCGSRYDAITPPELAFASSWYLRARRAPRRGHRTAGRRAETRRPARGGGWFRAQRLHIQSDAGRRGVVSCAASPRPKRRVTWTRRVQSVRTDGRDVREGRGAGRAPGVDVKALAEGARDGVRRGRSLEPRRMRGGRRGGRRAQRPARRLPDVPYGEVRPVCTHRPASGGGGARACDVIPGSGSYQPPRAPPRRPRPGAEEAP